MFFFETRKPHFLSIKRKYISLYKYRKEQPMNQDQIKDREKTTNSSYLLRD